MTITLRPYQLEIIDQARFKLKTVKRLLLQASCGAGKTVMAAYITNGAKSKNKRVMFLVHRDELMSQCSRTMTAFGIEHGFISANYTPKPYAQVQIAMVDTLRNRLSQVQVPDILIVDECHHAVSPTFKKIIDHYRSLGCVVVGLSATPQRLDGRALSDMFDDMVLGPTTKQLIALGNLANYAYFAPPQVADLEGLKIKFGDYDAKEQAERIDKPHVFGDAISHYQKIMHGKRAIAFNINIKASQHFAAQCRAAGIPALHVDGEMPKSERAAAIKSFESGETWILSNVSLFGEGFDVSACDGVILLRKTSSLSLFIQMCGRAMRPHESKEKAIILDHMSNVAQHGLPDDDHDWSLEGRKKGKKKTSEVVPIRQCPKCYFVFEPQRCCPQCGFDMGKTPAELEQIEGELKEVIREQEAIQQVQKKREVGQAKTLQDLEKIAQERGYKKNWAKFVFESRANKK